MSKKGREASKWRSFCSPQSKFKSSAVGAQKQGCLVLSALGTFSYLSCQGQLVGGSVHYGMFSWDIMGRRGTNYTDLRISNPTHLRPTPSFQSLASPF